MDLSTAREIAARIWCDKEISNRVLNPKLVEKIAKIIYREYKNK